MSPSTVVTTSGGALRGVAAGDLLVWRGVPYARPPTGPLRFQPPRPALPWPGVRAATGHGAQAWQGEAQAHPLGGPAASLERSEDCLYLNITVPAASPPGPGGYPVLLWVHGGGYVQGSGAGAGVGDGAALARHGMIVVTFNYRLGALGFLPLGDVLGPAEINSGSAGFLDQVAALRWVAANIGAFGGDPARITVYGVSAGAKSVANLLASPLTAGLVSQAISGSGGADQVATADQGRRLRRRYFAELGLRDEDAGQLRDIAPADLLAAQEAIATGAAGTWVWRPVLGRTGLPVPPLRAISAGAAAGIPLLIGSNGHEGATYALLDPTAGEQAPRVLSELFGAAAAAAMLDAYALARPELDQAGIRLAVLGDERYGIPTQRLALAQSAHAPVWRYRYDACPAGLPPAMAGGHGADLIAIWAGRLPGHGAADRLSQAMGGAWGRFVRGHPPGGEERLLPAWGQFRAGDELTMILDQDPRTEQYPRSAELEIWRDRNWPSGTWWDLGI